MQHTPDGLFLYCPWLQVSRTHVPSINGHCHHLNQIEQICYPCWTVQRKFYTHTSVNRRSSKYRDRQKLPLHTLGVINIFAVAAPCIVNSKSTIVWTCHDFLTSWGIIHIHTVRNILVSDFQDISHVFTTYIADTWSLRTLRALVILRISNI